MRRRDGDVGEMETVKDGQTWGNTYCSTLPRNQILDTYIAAGQVDGNTNLVGPETHIHQTGIRNDLKKPKLE
jgi:hypothetical protein